MKLIFVQTKYLKIKLNFIIQGKLQRNYALQKYIGSKRFRQMYCVFSYFFYDIINFLACGSLLSYREGYFVQENDFSVTKENEL